MSERTNAEWKQIAGKTAKWMKKIGAVHDDEKRHRSYVTSADWEDQFMAVYDLDATDLGTVIQHAHEMGHWIGFCPFKGWYLGNEPEEAATVVTRLINYLVSLSCTVGKYMEAQRESGHMLEIAAGYKGRIKLESMEEIAPLLNAAGVEVSESLRIALLEARDMFKDDDKDKPSKPITSRKKEPDEGELDELDEPDEE